MILLVAKAAAVVQVTSTNISSSQSSTSTELVGRGSITVAQQRLAEITEMLHTASLLHDDVIDDADSRRGIPSAKKIIR